MNKQIKLVIPMRIFAKPRPRQGKYGNFYTPRDEREDNLEGYFWQFIVENSLILIEHRISLQCKFYLKGKAGIDLDNALKSVMDCGEGILWKNDRQIKKFKEIAFIEYSGENRMEIIVEEIADAKNKISKKS